MGVQLSVIIPSFKERENVPELLRRLDRVLDGIAWEAIVVDDDSPDGTADVVRELAQEDPRIRCIQRIGRRGLSSACIEGMLASSAPYVAVIDADLQHDETILPTMYDRIGTGAFDLVVGSRYTEGGSVGAWGAGRTCMSRFATKCAQRLIRSPLTDPMSGFFMLRRDFLMRTVRRLSGKGFKILMDLVASSPEPVRVSEVPFTFRLREAGESKLDMRVLRDFFMQMVEKTLGRVIPVRFIMFVTVGAVGVLVHLAVLGVLYKWASMPFWESQAVATGMAMTGNFFINNLFTYNDLRLRGWRIVSGLLGFMVACSIGAVVNVLIATSIHAEGSPWALAGGVGIVISSVWNYSITRNFIWRGRT